LDHNIKPDKIWRIPNPVDLKVWRPMDRARAREELGLPHDMGIVIFHGRIAMHHKGIDVLLDAWERIRAGAMGQQLRLLIIGSGQDDVVLRERLKRSELSGVEWVNRFEHDRKVLRRYICAADISVLPSRIEGFPVAPLEAMACEVPIIGSDIPPFSDILENGTASGGLIVPREDASALADAILGLLENPSLRRELGLNARRNVETRFSVEMVGQQLDRMLSQRHPVGLSANSSG
jgi:glycosyltransferase involved in cell wall biosynthesis